MKRCFTLFHDVLRQNEKKKLEETLNKYYISIKNHCIGLTPSLMGYVSIYLAPHTQYCDAFNETTIKKLT